MYSSMVLNCLLTAAIVNSSSIESASHHPATNTWDYSVKRSDSSEANSRLPGLAQKSGAIIMPVGYALFSNRLLGRHDILIESEEIVRIVARFDLHKPIPGGPWVCGADTSFAFIPKEVDVRATVALL